MRRGPATPSEALMNDVPAGSYRPAPEGVGRGRFAVGRTRLGGMVGGSDRLGGRPAAPADLRAAKWPACPHFLPGCAGQPAARCRAAARGDRWRTHRRHSRNRPHHPATPAARRRDQASSSGPSAVSVDQTKTAEADEPVEPGGKLNESTGPRLPASPDAETSPERS
jgi:hypothetical protein